MFAIENDYAQNNNTAREREEKEEKKAKPEKSDKIHIVYHFLIRTLKTKMSDIPLIKHNTNVNKIAEKVIGNHVPS